MKRSTADALFLHLLRPIGTMLPEMLELLDHIEDVGFWLKDLKGRFVWINLPGMHHLGVSDNNRGKVIGRTDYDFVEEVLASQYEIDDQRVLADERVISRVEVVGPSGQPVQWFATTKIPLRNGAGKIVGTAGIARLLPGKVPGIIQNSPVSAAINYISRHYGEPIQNRDLARECGLSERVFQRRFKLLYRCSPHTYLRRIRVRLSCNALAFSNKPINEVAHEHGFADQSHFTKEFHRLMDETPRSYRIRFRGGAAAEKPAKPRKARSRGAGGR